MGSPARPSHNSTSDSVDLPSPLRRTIPRRSPRWAVKLTGSSAVEQAADCSSLRAISLRCARKEKTLTKLEYVSKTRPVFVAVLAVRWR